MQREPASLFALKHSYRTQEGHVHVLELLTSVTKDAAVSHTFDPL
jgi:hypothetical protein